MLKNLPQWEFTSNHVEVIDLIQFSIFMFFFIFGIYIIENISYFIWDFCWLGAKTKSNFCFEKDRTYRNEHHPRHVLGIGFASQASGRLKPTNRCEEQVMRSKGNWKCNNKSVLPPCASPCLKSRPLHSWKTKMFNMIKYMPLDYTCFKWKFRSSILFTTYKWFRMVQPSHNPRF